MKKDGQKIGGLTLLEVIMAIVLFGILSVVVYGYFQSPDVDLATQTVSIKTHLRFAQLKAMNTSTIWGIMFNHGVYWLFGAMDTDSPVSLPGAENAQIDLASRYAISVHLNSNGSAETFFVAFDSLGRPGTSFSDDQLSPAQNDLNISVADGSGINPQSIVITANTGFIP